MSENGDSDDSYEVPPEVIELSQGNHEIEFNPIVKTVKEGHPYIEIVEQPQERGFRFRYVCEGASHGGIQGARSERGKKTYPSIKIHNHQGEVQYVVSLVTNEKRHRPHAHELIGKNCKDGKCTVRTRVNYNSVTNFPNLGIQHVTKKKVVNILTSRILEELRMQKRLSHKCHIEDKPRLQAEEEHQAIRQAEEQAKSMKLDAVRLCFEAYLLDDQGRMYNRLPPAISKPIFDSKAPGAAPLKICRMDRMAGCCTGSEEVFLLCDRVQKDDIAVRFYEEAGDGQIKWESYGVFGPADVHRQYAIVFKTPAYFDIHIDKPVHVLVQLKRLSDDEKSDPKPFTYFPQSIDKEEVAKKRKKKIFGSGGGGGFLGGSRESKSSFGGAGGSENRPSNIIISSSNAFTPINNALPADLPVSLPGYNLPEPSVSDSDSLAPLIRSSLMSVGNDSLGMDSSEDAKKRSQDKGLQTDQAAGHSDKTLRSSPSADKPKQTHSDSHIDQSRRRSEETDKDINRAEDQSTDQRINNSTDDSDDFVDAHSDYNSASDGEDYYYGHPHSPVYTTSDSEGPASLEGWRPQLSRQSQLANLISDVAAERLLLACQVAEQITKGLQALAMTGDISHLLLLLRHLTANQDENGDNVLHLGIIHHQPVIVQVLIRTVNTIPHLNIINELNLLKQSPLHLAFLTDQPDVAELLTKHGADPGLTDRNGNTVFHIAAKYDRSQCLRSIVPVKHKHQDEKPLVGINTLNYEGYTALHLASMSGSPKVMKLLIQAQADVNHPDGRSGRTALHHAVQNENVPAIGSLLMEGQADVNLQDYSGWTPLHIATCSKRASIIALLLTAGADPHVSTFENEDSSALDMAENMDNERILKVLRGEPITDVYSEIHSHDALLDSGMVLNSGDMHRLDAATRIKLSKLLDVLRPSADWIALSDHLGLSSLVEPLHGMKYPTRALLDNFEALDGTVEQLCGALHKMNRMDCLRLLRDDVGVALPDHEDGESITIAPEITKSDIVQHRKSSKDGSVTSLESPITSLEGRYTELTEENPQAIYNSQQPQTQALSKEPGLAPPAPVSKDQVRSIDEGIYTLSINASVPDMDA